MEKIFHQISRVGIKSIRSGHQKLCTMDLVDLIPTLEI